MLTDTRVASYHRSLIESMSVPEGADTIHELLDRLSQAVGAAIDAVESYEKGVQEIRSRRLTAVGTMLAAVAVPLTLLFAFLGINARQVNDTRSVFAFRDYGLWYLGIVGICGLVFAFALIWEKRR